MEPQPFMSKHGRLEATPLLELLQIHAYTQSSGVLWVHHLDVHGAIVFDAGGVVAACSPSGTPLLDKAAAEPNDAERTSLRRIAVLVSLRELLDLTAGDHAFDRPLEPESTLEGVPIRAFYEDGALDAGDLLLVLESAMSTPGPPVLKAPPAPAGGGEEARRHQRLSPVTIAATLRCRRSVTAGYLTNLSEGGTFFNADEFPEPDSECELQFELPWGLGACQATVRVTWRRDGHDSLGGAGLSFLALTPDSKERLNAYMARFRALAADVDAGT